MRERIEWIDVSKGILMVLVIAGHTHIVSVVDYLIYSFHMAAFFILSGITLNVSKGSSLTYYVKKRFKKVLIPYFFFSILLLLYQFTSDLFFHRGTFNLLSGLRSILLPMNVKGTTVYHLWFFPCIFLSDVLSYLVVRLWNKNRLYSLLLILTVFSVGIGCFLFFRIASVMTILPIGIFFILLGYIGRKRIESLIVKFNAYFMVSVLCFITTVFLNFKFGAPRVDMSSMTFGLWPLYIASSMFGSMIVFYVSQKVSKNFVLSRIGRNSMYYYGLHYEVLGIVNKIFGGGIFTLIITTFVQCTQSQVQF